MLSHRQAKFCVVLLLSLLLYAECKKALFEKFKSDAKCLARVLKSVKASPFTCIAKCNAEPECQIVNSMEESEKCELMAGDNMLAIRTEIAIGWSCYKTLDPSFSSVTKCTETASLCSVLGRTKQSPAQSCVQLSTTCSDYVHDSGLYWIQMREGAVQMFCDMETLGGGWVEVARLNTTQNGVFHLEDAESSDIQKMSQVASGKFALSQSGLRALKEDLNFTQIRFRCSKPSHSRTIDISVNSSVVVNWLLGYTDRTARPGSCGSFYTLPGDTSLLSKSCESWDLEGRWGPDGAPEAMLFWVLTFFTSYQAHWHFSVRGTSTWPGYYFCDDYQPYTNQGVWSIFIK